MLPKLICFIFGHEKRSKRYSKEEIELSIRDSTMRYFHWVENKVCPRCGAKLGGK